MELGSRSKFIQESITGFKDVMLHSVIECYQRFGGMYCLSLLVKMQDEREKYGTDMGGTRWSSWLTHCATSQKVAGSIFIDIILSVALWPWGQLRLYQK
jgi:hypothetical protein